MSGESSSSDSDYNSDSSDSEKIINNFNLRLKRKRNNSDTSSDDGSISDNKYNLRSKKKKKNNDEDIKNNIDPSSDDEFEYKNSPNSNKYNLRSKINKDEDDFSNQLIRLFIPNQKYNKKIKQTTTPKWIKNISIDNRKKYIDVYNKIVEYNKKPYVPIKEIIDSNLSFKEKANMIEKKEAIDEMYDNSIEWEWISIRNEFISEFNNLKKIRKKPLNIKIENKIKKKREILLNKLHLDDHEQTLEERILLSNKSEEDKLIMYDKYLQLSSDKNSSGDEKNIKWIKLSLRIPIKLKNDNELLKIINFDYNKNLSNNNKEKINEIQIFEILNKIRIELDKKIFSMNKAKDKIIEILYNKIINPKTKGNILALVGEPGIGKTYLMMKLSKILKLPMEKLSMGGIYDSEFLTGTRPLYVGSEPGSIAKSLIKMKCINGILFMDEFDKISNNNRSTSDIFNTLLPILDYSQNLNWDGDQYFSPLKLNLSNIWFVLSMNNENEIPDVLRDRLDIVKINGYTILEKINIAKMHILPEIYENLVQDNKNFIFENKSIDNIIKELTDRTSSNKSGVRYIKHFFQSIISKLSLLRLHILYLFKQMKKNNFVNKNQYIKKIKSQINENTYYNYLSKEYKIIVKEIFKETKNIYLEENKIYISYKILKLMSENIIYNNDDNKLLHFMYM